MGKYEPYYPNGWQMNQSGGTPILPGALNRMEEGIKAAFRSENLIAVYSAPVDFTDGVGYWDNSAIHVGGTVPFVQLRAGAVESIVNTTLGVTVEEGRLKIVMDYAKTVADLPVNIIVILT